ncbi:MAG: head-tail adaptor protein [Rubrivivax sp.]|nr:MAG: head-tail adaptor protein [Rubrivivax sp.]
MATIPNAGELSQRVKLQTSAQAENALGEREPTWEDLSFADVWAKWQDLRGRELSSQGQMQTSAEARCVIRFRGDVNEHTRVMYRDQAYSIVGRPIVLGRRQFLELMLTSGPRERLPPV